MQKENDCAGIHSISPSHEIVESGNTILDAEEYQFNRRQQVKQSPIIDLDAIQREKFAIKPRVCEDVLIA